MDLSAVLMVICSNTTPIAAKILSSIAGPSTQYVLILINMF